MKWTEEEVNLIKSNYEKMTDFELSKLLNRGIGQVSNKRRKLNLNNKKKFQKWTVDEIEILKEFSSEFSSTELTKLLPNHSAYAIQHKCKRLKIRKTSNFMSNHGKKFLVDRRGTNNWVHYHKVDQTFGFEDLDNEMYQVLIGSMLGDGGVSKQSRGKKYLFKETHGMEQKNYLEWKRLMLNKFQPCKISGKKPTFSTPVHPIFKTIRKEFYNEEEERKAYIPLKHIEKLDELGLLIWYLDDGFTSHQPSIGSSVFEEENLKEVVKIINQKLNLSLIMTCKEIEGYLPSKTIKFHKINRDKIMPIWKNLFNIYQIPKCMEYKLHFPKDNPILWKEWEIDIIKHNIDKTPEKIHEILSSRSCKAIRYRKTLLLKNKKNHY